MKVIGAVGVLVFVGIPLAIWQGFAFSILWGWFAVPVFDAPKLSVAAAMGLALIVEFLTMKTPTHDKSDTVEMLGRTIVKGAFLPAFSLAIGWVVKGFM